MTSGGGEFAMNMAFQVAKNLEGREQLTHEELLANGMDDSEIADAVSQETLKKGVQGYWLPRPCDPGFLAVLEHTNPYESGERQVMVNGEPVIATTTFDALTTEQDEGLYF